ncbi:MAG: MotA/TolQ/ExbB proton channel family protein [Gammaproteobacteria bacterium]|nr:MotA/TolQ/ExbB proton channel family protein [Gammaproteobacteria bacterium]
MSLRTVEHHYTRNVLIQLVVLFALVVIVVIWQHEFLSAVYLKNQITSVGWVINGSILLLFLSGLIRLVQLYVRYTREEAALNAFINNMTRTKDPTEGLPVDSMIVDRYDTLQDLHNRHALINHGALAATLVAEESSYASFPKFVNNVLILTGVFGTIVSLSIALLGATDMIAGSSDTSGLHTVIHGMSTALSTTMTAILAFLFFSYFYLRLSDTQTYLISRVEDITANYLVPKFQHEPESVMNDFSELIRASSALTKRLDETHERFAQTAGHMEQMINDYRQEVAKTNHYFNEIVHLLREGFRLSERD